MIERKVTITNRLGLHARAAAKLVQCANRFASRIQLCKQDQEVNAKSIMGVMMLAASKGTELQLRAEGEDEAEAADAIVELIDDKFGEGE